MAKRIAQFHKVSFEQFAEGFQDTFGEKKEGELIKIQLSESEVRVRIIRQ